MFAAAWGGNEFTPLLVMYRAASHISDVTVDSLLFLYVLGIVPALLIGGPLSDRFGRRPLMLPSPVIAGLGSVLLAFGEHSVPLLAAGRVLSGIALGLAMAVGGSWIKELSDADGAGVSSGARRAALSLTAGFGLGAALASILAQWAPLPGQLAYLVNIALTVVAFVMILRTPETRPRGDAEGSLLDDLKIPSARNRRFWLIVAPVAPWVFGTCAVAYAVVPVLLAGKTASWSIAFAGLCCLVGLAAGFFIQSVGRRLDRPGSARALVVALIVVAAGMGLAVLAAYERTVVLGIVAAAVLGCGYGLALIGGLLEVQRIAGPDDLAGLTAVFYGLTYLGFASPAAMAWCHSRWEVMSYPLMLGIGAIVALLSVVFVTVAQRMLGDGAPDAASSTNAGETPVELD
ncbi:MAG: MFS transporter [Gordonia sp. (in: high G+C Gram-positive bacteria)]